MDMCLQKVFIARERRVGNWTTRRELSLQVKVYGMWCVGLGPSNISFFLYFFILELIEINRLENKRGKKMFLFEINLFLYLGLPGKHGSHFSVSVQMV